MPEGNIFEFASSRILKFEHKWNTDKGKKKKLDYYKSLADSQKKNTLEKSMVKSERSVSARTVKSAKEEFAPKSAKDLHDKDGKSPTAAGGGKGAAGKAGDKGKTSPAKAAPAKAGKSPTSAKKK